MSLSPYHGIFSFGEPPPTSAHQTSLPKEPEIQEQPSKQVERKPQKTVGQIAVDIYEKDGYYVIRAPIAGVRLSDLDIEIEDKVVTIRGVRRSNEDTQDDQYYLRECFWGEFSRSVTLPCVVDPKKVKATFSKDSILKILIPREEKVKIVRINEGG